MPKGSCDPGPGQTNALDLAMGDGTVLVSIRYGWDGVSTVPNCDGPIESIRLRNTGSTTWIVVLPSGRQAKNRPIAPGVDQTFSGAQLAAIGLETRSDVEGFELVVA